MSHPASPQQTVQLTQELTSWLARSGLADSREQGDLAVDLADLLAASKQVAHDVTALLAINPLVPEEADRALGLAANIEVQLFTELAGHLDSLRESWPKVLERLERLTAGKSVS